jgi:hypothetical protein
MRLRWPMPALAYITSTVSKRLVAPDFRCMLTFHGSVLQPGRQSRCFLLTGVALPRCFVPFIYSSKAGKIARTPAK